MVDQLLFSQAYTLEARPEVESGVKQHNEMGCGYPEHQINPICYNICPAPMIRIVGLAYLQRTGREIRGWEEFLWPSLQIIIFLRLIGLFERVKRIEHERFFFWFTPWSCWARPKQGTQSSIHVSQMGGKGPHNGAIFHYFPGTSAGT